MKSWGGRKGLCNELDSPIPFHLIKSLCFRPSGHQILFNRMSSSKKKKALLYATQWIQLSDIASSITCPAPPVHRCRESMEIDREWTACIMRVGWSNDHHYPWGSSLQWLYDCIALRQNTCRLRQLCIVWKGQGCSSRSNARAITTWMVKDRKRK